jgi:hypothetical protein
VIGVGVVILRVVAPRQMVQKFDNTTENVYEADAAAVMSDAGVPLALVSAVSTLPIGDFAVRLSLSVASLWFFIQHPFGVGFWGELPVVGWYAHHEIVKIAVEQSIIGLAAFGWLMFSLRRLLWNGRDFSGSHGQLGVLLRSISVGLFAALIGANTVLLDLKYALVYWSLVGVWSVIPVRQTDLVPILVREAEVVTA